MRTLYIHSTQVPPPLDERTDRFFLLSESLEGDVWHQIWFNAPEEVEAEFGPGSFPVYVLGLFRYHWFLAIRPNGLAAGVPVVGSGVGLIPDLIHQGENGFVVPGGNVRELRARLRELLAGPDLRRRMGANGCELAHTQLTELVYVEKFTAMDAAAVRSGP
jgi:glycosyltransferase involved in cell wall biosynthesis